MRKFLQTLILLGLVLSMNSTGSQAALLNISNDRLAVSINDTNGAIREVYLDGVKYYTFGTWISNWGMQFGVTTPPKINTNPGNEQIPVAVTQKSGSVEVAGTFSSGSYNVDFTRIYSLVPGLNVLRTTSTITNKGNDVVFSYFDTFDPDLGENKSTMKDVLDLATPRGNVKIAQAIGFNNYSVVYGSLNPNATVGTGRFGGINDKDELNDFFLNPPDDNGATNINGAHIGIRKSLTSGQVLTYTFDQAYGASLSEAQNQFSSAQAPVPEPSSMLLGLLSLGGLFGIKRKKSVSV